MNTTKIEWCDLTWNPVTGCTHGCEYCYALEITNRFKANYPNGFHPTFHPSRLNAPSSRKKPARIFTVSMGDLFSPGVLPTWQAAVLDVVRRCPQHTFIVLTKRPDNVPGIKFPRNLWLGVSITGDGDLWRVDTLARVPVGVRFASFEPLLSPVMDTGKVNALDWVIIGGLTGRVPFIPPVVWSQRIIDAAREHGIPVFLKDNLCWCETVHEWPEVIP